MRVIIFESTVYKLTEKQYFKLKLKESEMGDLELSDYLDSEKEYFDTVGSIDFDFRL